MPSTYPSVTAKAKGTAPKPVNYQKGKGLPANDNKIGIIKVAKLPRPYLKPPRFGLVVGPLVQDWADEVADAANGIIAAQAPVVMPSTFWALNTFGCGAGYPSTQFVHQSACTWYNNPTGSQPFTGTTTTRTSFFQVDTRIHQTQGRQIRLTGQWSKVSGSPTPTPTVAPSPAFAPTVFPIEIPASQPLISPIARPSLAPKPAVWSRPKPGDQPTAAEFAPTNLPFFLIVVNDLPLGQVTVPRVPRKGGGRPPPVRPPIILPPMPVPIFQPGQPDPALPPVVNPGSVIVANPRPGFGPVVSRTRDWGRPRPPRAPATIEKKAKVSSTVGLIWAGINSVTEAFDFIKAMHDSLPKHLQLSSKASKAQIIEYMLQSSPAEAAEIWKNIDLAEAVENFINMQISDMAAALGSTAIKRVNQDTGMITGLDRAIRQHGDRLGDLDPESNDNWTDLIPTLDIDREAGVISITGPLGVLALRKKWLRKGK